MSQCILRVSDLPANALEAAAVFHATHMPAVRALLAEGPGSVVIVLPAAPYDHEGWRRALVRDLARACAPQRINMLAGGDTIAADAALAYLERAQGVTGQLFDLDSQGAADSA